MMQVWDLFLDKHMFSGQDEKGDLSATAFVAEMAAYLDFPPEEYLKRSEVTKNVFTEQGKWKLAGKVPIPRLTFDDPALPLEGENRALFLNLMKSMLEWEPEKRKTAAELLEDPWMRREAETF